jgi:hypothetical protein
VLLGYPLALLPLLLWLLLQRLHSVSLRLGEVECFWGRSLGCWSLGIRIGSKLIYWQIERCSFRNLNDNL